MNVGSGRAHGGGAVSRRLLKNSSLFAHWASMKSFRRKGGSDHDPGAPGRNGERSFKDEKRPNNTHASTNDPDARLYRKGNGQSGRLCFTGHLLMENRNGLIVDKRLTLANGAVERKAALSVPKPRAKRRTTVAGDKAYDVSAFARDLRKWKITPHTALNNHVSKTGKRRWSAIDERATRHADYAILQTIHQRIEEGFGWVKFVGGLANSVIVASDGSAGCLP